MIKNIALALSAILFFSGAQLSVAADKKAPPVRVVKKPAPPAPGNAKKAETPAPQKDEKSATDAPQRQGESETQPPASEAESASTGTGAAITGTGTALTGTGSAIARKTVRKGDAKPAAQQPKEKATISMNFSGMDIAMLIKFIAESTGKNFIINDKVQGKVTILSPKKVTKEEAYKVFESILAVYGFSAVPAGDVIKVVPVSEARLLGGTMEKSTDIPIEMRDQMVTQLIPLKYISADNMVNAVRPLIPPTSYIASYQQSNTVIIVDLASNIDRLLTIISRLDVEGRETNITVIPLKHAAAKDVQAKITSLLGREIGKPQTGPNDTSNTVISDDRLNALIILGNDLFTNKVRFIVTQLDVESPPGRQEIHVVYLNNANADDMAKVLNQILVAEQKRAAPGPQAQQDLATVTADKATNSIIITSSPEQYANISKVLSKLDIQRKQVFVEAAIFEIRSTKQKQFGIEWRSTTNVGNGTQQVVAGTNFSNGNIGNVMANPVAGTAGAGLIIGAVDGTITFGGTNFANIGALISALQSDTDVNVLSTPTLLTTDNEEAKLFVGQNVPFIQSSSQTTGGLPVQNIQRQDVGTTLRITPQISANKFVRLKIYTETSSVSPTQIAKAQDIITFKRSAETVAIVKDSQNVAIGGLIQDTLTEVESKVPFFGSIPLIGWLFKTKSTSVDKTNLLIFLTPHIINTVDVMSEITQKNLELLDKLGDKDKKNPNFRQYGIGDTTHDDEDEMDEPSAEPKPETGKK